AVHSRTNRIDVTNHCPSAVDEPFSVRRPEGLESTEFARELNDGLRATIGALGEQIGLSADAAPRVVCDESSIRGPGRPTVQRRSESELQSRTRVELFDPDIASLAEHASQSDRELFSVGRNRRISERALP